MVLYKAQGEGDLGLVLVTSSWLWYRRRLEISLSTSRTSRQEGRRRLGSFSKRDPDQRLKSTVDEIVARHPSN